MAQTLKQRINDSFKALACDALPAQAQGLAVTSPIDGSIIAQIAADNKKTLEQKIKSAKAAQAKWYALKRDERAALLETLSASLKQYRGLLAEILTLEAGKTVREAFVEIDGSADILLKTIKDAVLPELGAMLRCKERPAAGIVGLITSFNFPLIVANWTLAPALLAGNAILWKPSEKTPLVALAYKSVFDKAAGKHDDLLQIVIGAHDIGEALVSHEQVDMVSATGSVAMGKGIKKTLAAKKNNGVKPILELGGNNGVIISDKISGEHLEWSITALLGSFLGTTGQRCTNARRLIVQRKLYDKAASLLKNHVEKFIVTGGIQNPLGAVTNDYGYSALIDKDAYLRFERAKTQAAKDGGTVLFGKRVFEKEYPEAYYIEPALALMPKQTPIMHEETFAPLLYLVPYDRFDEAITLLNAPANAGLVSAIYTQSQQEADQFAAQNEAGHSVINSPKGTGMPGFGMGFGGNKESGTGEILNTADPLMPFTRDHKFTRIAQNKEIKMDVD